MQFQPLPESRRPFGNLLGLSMTEATEAHEDRATRQPLRSRVKTAFAHAVRLNIRLCSAITPQHIRETSAFFLFRAAFLDVVVDLEPKVVVDIGAGKQWHQRPGIKRLARFRLIGVDINAEEMSGNEALDERVVSDVTKSIDVPAGCADVVTVRSGVEHFSDNAAFLRNLHDLLRPGGRALLVFPGRYAPFVLINRMLPTRIARALLRVLVPGSDGVLGFQAHYDRTSYRQFTRMAERAGFKVVRRSCSFYSSVYFRFFVPLYVLSLVLDHLRHMIAIKDLASFYLFVLEKPASDPGGEG
jgi:SAM-dependent methyltransferase